MRGITNTEHRRLKSVPIAAFYRTAKGSIRMPKLGTTTWDAALARRLYDEGATYKHIGEQVGAAASLVNQFASRH
jgi:hypothetical protein